VNENFNRNPEKIPYMVGRGFNNVFFCFSNITTENCCHYTATTPLYWLETVRKNVSNPANLPPQSETLKPFKSGENQKQI